MPLFPHFGKRSFAKKNNCGEEDRAGAQNCGSAAMRAWRMDVDDEADCACSSGRIAAHGKTGAWIQSSGLMEALKEPGIRVQGTECSGKYLM